MNQFAAECNAQELGIRYSFGLRNSLFLSFQRFIFHHWQWARPAGYRVNNLTMGKAVSIDIWKADNICPATLPRRLNQQLSRPSNATVDRIL